MVSKFQNNHVYTFDTLAPAILGARFKNATHLGSVGYEIAQSRENVFIKYRLIYPSLPQGTVNDHAKQNYHLFRTETNQVVCLCEQWINLETVEEIQSIDFQIKFVQGTIQQMNEVRDILIASGYNNFTME